MKTGKLGFFALLLTAGLMITFASCKRDGCTDATAKNYDEKAKKDDGSCVFDDVVVVDPYLEMTTYMSANSLDLSTISTDAFITADNVNTTGTGNFYIMDIRADTAFARGHIAGAVNTPLANIVTQAANAGSKPILIVCYTGQSAAYGLVALRLSGYSTAKALKFGMSSWNGSFDSWTANIDSIATGNSNWSSTNTIQANVTYSKPTFTTTLTTGQEVLNERITVLLNEGFQGVKGSDVLASPSTYFINNYWTDAKVTQYGHITGAHRVMEDLTLAADGFKYMDKDATIVTYCWTGQGSAIVTAYLNVLGYHAKSLKFGANGLIYDQLQENKWSASGSYPVELQ
ncbi:MAG: hypothetical protein KKD31_11960 [Bacteroidetes bacterium]|nr:hypothetical protein [Bacteroidota bacterium]